MASISQTQSRAHESVGEGDWGGPKLFRETLRSLTIRLNGSTVGVALFDKSLHCRVLNGTLARMSGVSTKKPNVKRLRQVFPGEAPKLELAFRRVLKTGNSLSNLELTARLAARTKPRRWLVNCHPISDASGQVLLVAAIFSEVTKARSVELNLCRLKEEFRSKVTGGPNLLGQEYSVILTRTIELVNRSVALLKDSIFLQLYAAEMRLEAGLMRHALFLSANRAQESISSFTLPQVDPGSDPLAAPSPPNETAPPNVCPSPRERQVLRFLADGKSNKEIGSILDISTRTVESYRARIMQKLDLHSTAALVRYAIRNNIVEA